MASGELREESENIGSDLESRSSDDDVVSAGGGGDHRLGLTECCGLRIDWMI